MRGVTLAEPRDEQDTTTVLEGKISIVCVFTGTWAERQAASFFDGNEKLHKVLDVGKEVIQRVDVNIEENKMKAGLIQLFMGGIRKKLPEEQHPKYFLVRKGVTDDMRHNMGIFNSQVGYVYLLDSKCRIRWAGNAEAESGEKESLVVCIKRLVQELKKRQTERDAFEEGVAVEAIGSVHNAVSAIVV